MFAQRRLNILKLKYVIYDHNPFYRLTVTWLESSRGHLVTVLFTFKVRYIRMFSIFQGSYKFNFFFNVFKNRRIDFTWILIKKQKSKNKSTTHKLKIFSSFNFLMSIYQNYCFQFINETFD